MKKQTLELLAPAGSFESLKAAVANGADAVYLGGGRFNARVNAGNFTEEELITALDYAHERGVRVYLTLNTLIKNDEIKEALEFAAFAYQQGADAVIVQDMGFLSLLREALPELSLHASTQMTLTNLPSVHALEAQGVNRIVLSRELSIEEIEGIAKGCKAEVEVFVHGALCVCYSGQCLMSSFIGGRSGNRGLCAQPCRLPWSISRDGEKFDKSGYLISPRDLMAIELLPQLKKAGVTSLKLEGRMKSPEYVAIVTSIYRKYVDLMEVEGEKGYSVKDADRECLLQAFNRGGFTQNYLKGDRTYKNLVYTRHPKNQGILVGTVTDSKPLYARISLDKPLAMGDGLEIMDEEKGAQSLIVTAIQMDNQHYREAPAGTHPWVGDIKTSVKKGSQVFKTLSKPLFEEAKLSYERYDAHHVPLKMALTLRVGEPARLKVTDEDGNTVLAETGIMAEKALHKPLSAERLQEQLQKTGDTPYWLENLTVDTDDQSTLPVSALNALRREALEALKSERITKTKRQAVGPIALPLKETGRRPERNLKLTAYFNDFPESLKGLNGLVKRVYIPIAGREQLERLKIDYKGELFLITPPILKDGELEEIMGLLAGLADLFDGLTYGNLGTFKKLREAYRDKLLCADYTTNVFNDKSVTFHEGLGVDTVVLSPELNLSEVQAFDSSACHLEALIYGSLPLMTMEHCPSASESECSNRCETCVKSKGFLKDRKGEVFPFIRDPVLKRTRLFNAFPLFMDDASILNKTPLSLLRLTFIKEDSITVESIVRHYHSRVNGYNAEEPILQRVKELKDRGFTKGHWFRGVE